MVSKKMREKAKRASRQRILKGLVKVGGPVAGFDPERHGRARNLTRVILPPERYEPELPLRTPPRTNHRRSSTPVSPRQSPTDSRTPAPSTPGLYVTQRSPTSIVGQQQISPLGTQDLQARWWALVRYQHARLSGMSEADAAAQVAEEEGCSVSTLRSWYKRGLEEGDLRRKVSEGHRGRDLSVVSDAMGAIMGRVRAHIPQRTLLSLTNSILAKENEPSVSLQTLQRILNSEGWAKVKQVVVPVCTPETREERRLWCKARLAAIQHPWIDRILSRTLLAPKLEVHIDEKHFYAWPRSTRLLYLPTSLVEELKYVHRVEKKNKKRQPHLMFLAAVARPEEGFDGKIGLWPLIEEGRLYQRSGKNYRKGQRKVVPLTITKDIFLEFLWTRVLPGIFSTLTRLNQARSVVIQMDFAGGHGGGPGGRSRKVGYEAELNMTGASVVQEAINDGRCPKGTSVVFDVQPSSSPDLNALDLGVWYSIAAGVDDARAGSVGEGCAGTVLEGLLKSVTERWDKSWDARTKLSHIFATRDRILEVVAVDGTNTYKIPRSGVSHANEGPAFLPTFDEEEEDEIAVEANQADLGEGTDVGNEPLVVEEEEEEEETDGRSMDAESDDEGADGTCDESPWTAVSFPLMWWS